MKIYSWNASRTRLLYCILRIFGILHGALCLDVAKKTIALSGLVLSIRHCAAYTSLHPASIFFTDGAICFEIEGVTKCGIERYQSLTDNRYDCVISSCGKFNVR